jgi:hypothetical protein
MQEKDAAMACAALGVIINSIMKFRISMELAG